MSGVVALAALDGRPIAAEDVARLCAAAAYRGPDGTVTWTSASVGLGYLAFHTHPHSEPQPVVMDDGKLAIVFDGRIDNRDDLLAELDIRDATLGDASLTVEAYRRWSDDAPAHIIGDFAFALWDARQRRLFCGRDALGIRPFYYHVSARMFVCASDLAQVMAAPGVPVTPNEGMIAEYLANAITDRSETIYAGIHRLPAAHALSVPLAGQPALGRYWKLDTTRELRCRSDEEYAGRFRELFEAATRARLRATRPVGVYLSGGTDSSAVAAMAGALSEPTARPAYFTLAFDDPATDETQYVRDLAAFWSATSYVTRTTDPARTDPPTTCRDVHDCLVDVPVLEWKRGIAATGTAVMLSGQGGDAGFFGSSFAYADLLRRGRLLALYRQYRAAALDPEWRASSIDLAKYGIWPLLPRRLRGKLRPLLGRLADIDPVPSWIEPDFAHRVDLRRRLRPPLRPAPSSAREDIYANYQSGWMSVYLETAERESAAHGLEDRHPLLDRRVVEFAISLPDDQRWRGPLTRWVIRQALAGLLPPSVRDRQSRGSGSMRLVRALEAMGGEAFFDHLTVAEAGWIRQDAIAAMYRRMWLRVRAGDVAYNDDAFPLWMVGGVELWFRRTCRKAL